NLRRAQSVLEEQVVRRAGVEDVKEALGAFRASWREHVEFTEAPEGLFDEVLGTAAEAAPEVDRLRRDHVTVSASLDRVDDLLGRGVDAGDPRVRDTLEGVLKTVEHHRRRGAALLYDLYSVDATGGGS